ncbi:MAG: 5-formyltetrahydrofolate cyclo-ligase [Candidatus Omnitrophica bacterium]|nr:5-formyltetrahydrofolate cyclo-ligase [Candidatus Omnitrophota bacterium]
MKGLHLLTKEQIRSRILVRLKIQKEEEREKKSRIINDKLFKTFVFKRAKIIMFYLSFDGEVDTREMIKGAQKLGKIVVVPVCGKNKTMRAALLKEGSRLRKGLYGIAVPAIKNFISLKEIDLVVVPAVAFDKKGNRLGRGKGYYDRFLKRVPKDTASVGLAFDFQILPFIPSNRTDISVNRVVFA